MKTLTILLAICLFTACQFNSSQESDKPMAVPDDFLYRQRAYPHNQLDKTAYLEGVRQIQIAQTHQRSNHEWKSAGPKNIGGRITAIAVSPINTNRYYVGTASGGVFWTNNGGNSWGPLFDKVGSPSIGDIAVAPDNPDIIYVGTGTPNGSGNSGAFFGNGIYKTTDNGQTWTHMGLENTQQIGRIIVDPNNTQRIFVAALGGMYNEGPNRGLYRSLDGGESWEKIFFVNNATSCVDVLMFPTNSNILYAVTWERTRRINEVDFAGEGSGIYRSFNGGSTWEELTNGLPNLGEDAGRISMAISPSRPKVMYASYTTGGRFNEFYGFYRSDDGGNSWEPVGLGSAPLNLYSNFGWFFGNMRVDPNDENKVYALGVNLHVSTDGGENWITNQDMHVDHHAMTFHPFNTDLVLAGNDGGVYRSDDAGGSWRKLNSLPITQFYNCAFDPKQPNQLYGGTQDNGTVRTLGGQLDDWQEILGGDGFHVAIDPTDSDNIYAEMQGGRLFRSVDGGQTFLNARNGIDTDDRSNFNTPFVIDPNNAQTLYIGTQRVYRSDNRAVSWQAISPDLSGGPQPVGSLASGTITSIAVAPSNSQYIYVGTDDGRVQGTNNGGTNWTNLTDNLPNRHVTSVAVDPSDELSVYVTFSGYRYEDFLPHVFHSTDGGDNWTDISANLPEVPVNDIIIDPVMDGWLYVATDLGVWFSVTSGEQWTVLGEKLPVTAVTDLSYEPTERELVAATFGRGLYTLDLDQVSDATEVSQELAQLQVYPNPAHQQFTLHLDLKTAVDGRLELYDLMGRLVSQLDERSFEAGENRINYELNGLAAGAYVLRLRSVKGGYSCRLLVQ